MRIQTIIRVFSSKMDEVVMFCWALDLRFSKENRVVLHSNTKKRDFTIAAFYYEMLQMSFIFLFTSMQLN